MSYLNREGVSNVGLARQTGYSPVIHGEPHRAGKNPPDTGGLLRTGPDVLDLSTVEKDALVRSWALGRENRSWRLSNAP